MRRSIIALAASLAVPAGLTVALPAASASASNVAATIVTCGSAKGSVSIGGTISGCNTTAITGGHGHLTGNSTGTTFKIKWSTGKTTLGTSKPTVLTTSTCPSTFPTEISEANTVTGGTAKALIGGKTTNKICVNTTTSPITFELLPGTKYKI